MLWSEECTYDEKLKIFEEKDVIRFSITGIEGGEAGMVCNDLPLKLTNHFNSIDVVIDFKIV